MNRFQYMFPQLATGGSIFEYKFSQKSPLHSLSISSSHTLTPSFPHTFTPSHLHSITPSLHHTFTPSPFSVLQFPVSKFPPHALCSLPSAPCLVDLKMHRVMIGSVSSAPKQVVLFGNFMNLCLAPRCNRTPFL